MMDADHLPGYNALLNTTSAILLVVGWLCIRGRLVTAHKACMLSALAVSALFLASYLYLHFVLLGGRATRFAERAPEAPYWIAWTYYGVLLSHTILAVAAAPLALASTYLGLRGLLPRHVAIARWTLPIWLYVSVTGVVVYWMLYRLYPS